MFNAIYASFSINVNETLALPKLHTFVIHPKKRKNNYLCKVQHILIRMISILNE